MATQETIKQLFSGGVLRDIEDADARQAITALQNALNALTSGDTTTAIENFQEVIDFLDGVTDDETLIGKITALQTAINGKQPMLTFDNAPTAGSNNPVKSGGVKTALDAKVNTETGKGLSSNDYTTAEKTKLQNLPTNPVRSISVNGEAQTMGDNGNVNITVQTGSQVDPSTSSPSMDGTAYVGTSTRYAREDHVHPHDTSKQDALTYDNAPTENSNNMVKSGAIYTALQNLLSNITIGANGNWFVGSTDTNIKAQGPKGNSVADGDTFDIVNNLTEGGESDALSAEMGKRLNSYIFGEVAANIDTSEGDLGNIIENNVWKSYPAYKGKVFDISAYKGWSFKIGNAKSGDGTKWYYRFAFLRDGATTTGTSAAYSVVSPYNAMITIDSTSDDNQWTEGTVPNDATHLYVYAYNQNYPTFGPPEVSFVDPAPQNRISALEQAVDGLDEIKEDWFDVEGDAETYQIAAANCWRQQSIGTNGVTYYGTNSYNGAPTVICAPKSAQQSVCASVPSDCFKISDLAANGKVELQLSSLSSGRWSINVAFFNNSVGFISRDTYVTVNADVSWKAEFNIPANAAYFKVLAVQEDASGNAVDATQVNLSDGWCSFQIGTMAKEGIPARVAALEEKVEDVGGQSMSKFTICSWNIGHFSLGKSWDTFISDQKQDLDYTNYGNSTPYSNFEAQRRRWRETLNEYSPDIIMMCEYITTFAHNSGGDVTTADAIFGRYPYNRVGTLPSSTSYMRTAAFANFKLGTSTQVTYAHTVQAGRYYQCVNVKIGSHDVKFVVTHLDFGDSGNGATYRAEQIQKLITDFTDESHVIICGDFNVSSGTEYEAFAQAGYTMANHDYLGDIMTYPPSGTEVWPSGGSKYVVDEPTSPLDNIMVKGFAMGNVRLINKKELSDHCGLVCNLTLIE